MTYIVYTIYDSVSTLYGKPFVALNDTMANRAFRDCLTNSQSPYSQHPDDYHLYAVGKFDEITGEVISIASYKVSDWSILSTPTYSTE